MITRKSLADEIDVYDQSIADLNAGKKDCFDAYRDQLIAAGVAKPNIKLEIEAVKAAIKRRRMVEKDAAAVEEKDALVDEVFAEITAAARAPRATREIIEQFDPETGEIEDRGVKPNRPGTAPAGRATDESPATISPAAPIPTGADGHLSKPSSDAGGGERAADEAGHTCAQSEQAVDQFEPPAFLARERKPLRPHCLRPEMCGGYGATHCGSCLRAAGVAA